MDNFKMPVLEPKPAQAPSAGDPFEAGFDKVFAPFPSAPAKKNTQPVFAPSAPASKSSTITEPEPAPNPTPNEKALAESRTKGFEEGYAKGFKDARNEADERNTRIEKTLSTLSQTLAQVLQERRFDDIRKAEEVTEIILRIAHKVAGAALTQNPAPEIEKVVKKSFETLFNEPYLVIYVHSDLLEDITQRINALTRAEGFRGTVEIKAKDSLSSGGCEIEWQGGGLKSDKDAMWKEISQLCDMPKDVFDT